MPAPIHYCPLYTESPIEAAYYAGLPARARRAGLFWVGEPLEAMYDADDFFDTNFHLVDEARVRHTNLLIAWLGATPFERCRRHYGLE